MNKDIKAKWVSALRSGMWEQTTNVLSGTNVNGVRGYCCLGVLCEISAAETGFGIRENLRENNENQDIGPTIRLWAGINRSCGGFVNIGGLEKSLTEANDDGSTFLEIATAIEEQL